MTATTIRRLAVLNSLVVALFIAGSYAFAIATWRDESFSAAFTLNIWLSPIVLLLAMMGTLVVHQRPGNAIGIGMCIEATFLALLTFADGYAVYGLEQDPGSIPHPELAAWLVDWIWVPAVMPLLTFYLLLCPDGTLLSPRWRRFAIFVAASLVGLSLAEAFQPGPIEDFPTLDNPLGIDPIGPALEVLGLLGYILLLPSILGSTYSMVSRFRRARGIERQQLKWFVSAGAAVFLLFIVTWIAGLAADYDRWDFTLGASAVLIILATGIAVLRYRLYEIDLIINRALVYGALTALLAGVYAASLQLFKILFTSATGETSDASVVLTTLFLAALFTPAKNRLQTLVDRYFGRKPDPAKELQAFQDELASVMKVLRPASTAEEFVRHAMHAFGATSGAVYVTTSGHATLLFSSEESVSDGQSTLEVPMVLDGEQVGSLVLGPRTDGSSYAGEDLETLSTAASIVAQAIVLGGQLGPEGWDSKSPAADAQVSPEHVSQIAAEG